MLKLINSLVTDESGQDLIEYALMAGFIAVAASAILPELSDQIRSVFRKVHSSLAAAATGGSDNGQ